MAGGISGSGPAGTPDPTDPSSAQAPKPTAADTLLSQAESGKFDDVKFSTGASMASLKGKLIQDAKSEGKSAEVGVKAYNQFMNGIYQSMMQQTNNFIRRCQENAKRYRQEG